ncbi:MAG: hypothetical protein PVF70_11670 [Anaerolineales bacterium]
MRSKKVIYFPMSNRYSLKTVPAFMLLVLAMTACGGMTTGNQPADGTALPDGGFVPVAVGDPNVLSEDQLLVLSDFGWPHAFHILAAYDGDNRLTRFETWSYYDGGIAYVFLDGEFLFDEEEEVYPSQLQVTTYRPDGFVLGQSMEDVRASHPGVEWTRVDSLEEVGEGVELYASSMILIGFSENQLISVSALAFLPGEGGAQ